MTVKIKKQAAGKRLINTVEQIAGVDLSACYQCKKCTSGCPVSKLVQCPPSEIIRRLHLGAGDEILESDIVWMCLSCETCYTRCPMKINLASVMDALRTLALEKGASRPEGNAPLFNRTFLGTVKAFGRTYDLPMIAWYKLGSGNLRQDLGKFPSMLAKGKLAVFPPSGADKQAVKGIFDRARQNKGTVK